MGMDWFFGFCVGIAAGVGAGVGVGSASGRSSGRRQARAEVEQQLHALFSQYAISVEATGGRSISQEEFIRAVMS
jgi:hypothetical protein